MSLNLTTDAALAEQFGLTLKKFHELRKRHNWPHTRFGRFDIRFTDLQVEQIIATMSVAPGQSDASGLSRRSASRRRAS